MKSLHKYLRAIGFSKLKDRKELQKLITNIIIESNERSYTSYDGNDTILTEFCKDFAENIGIAVCGVFDSDNKFIYDYYFPYMKGSKKMFPWSAMPEKNLMREFVMTLKWVYL